MKSPRILTLISTSLLPIAICLTALTVFQLRRPISPTVLARTHASQSLEAARDVLERATHDARLKPSGEGAAAVSAAFRDYLSVVSAQESEILNRIEELKSALGMTGARSGVAASADAQTPKQGARAEELRAEYGELNARLSVLRSNFGAALVEVNAIVGSQSRDVALDSVGGCDVLIINGASSTSEPDTTADATATLASIVAQNSGGGSVTVLNDLPASLAGVDVIYDIRFNPALSAGEVSAYLTFLQGGGKLLLVGENSGFFTRNSSVISFVSTAGGGSLTFCDPFCCSATCTDATLCSTPNTAATFFLPAPGATTSSGNGTALLTAGGSCRPVSVFRPGQLTNAPAGTLITFFDINTFQTQFSATNDNLKLICNIAGFFCGFTGGTCNIGGCVLLCPPDINVVAPSACLPASGAVVSYAPPQAFGNCGPVTCSPPSGSSFPLGTTTVTCTTPQGSGCSFDVTVSGACLQDDTNPGNVVVFNPQTGAYRFCCGGTVFTGVGSVITKGCDLTIQHSTINTRVVIKFNGSLKAGSASLQSPSGSTRCTITDRNTDNNTCNCQ
ncbi:MAG TPA: hypothetical protein VE262_18645 [Blastocatellia bacterium]|nr:hypothetical protein [Blastocatellia bacterium]